MILNLLKDKQHFGSIKRKEIYVQGIFSQINNQFVKIMEIRHISSAERKRLQNKDFMSLKVIF